MATEWQNLVKETMKKNKDMAFGDILKLAKKEYKKIRKTLKSTKTSKKTRKAKNSRN